MKANSKIKDKTNIVIITITLVAIVICVFMLLYISYITTNKIYTFNTQNENNLIAFNNHISKICDSIDTYSITLKHKDKEWTYTNADFCVNSNIHTILDGKHTHTMLTNNYSTTLNTMSNKLTKGQSEKQILNYIFLGLDEKISHIIKEIEYEPIDSTITFTGNRNNLFNITNSSNGLKVNIDELYLNIYQKFAKESNITIDIPVIETIPKVSKEQNLSLTKKIASYTTNVADSTGGRKTNVKLALSKINGLKVAPKEKVSFNKLTGPHTADTGYKPAIVIVNSEYVEDIGGGICQASTTLYNALIRAGVKIDEVRKHSLPVKYVPLALDAMVSEGVADLKFTNTSNYPIFINTYSDANSVTVDIYSHALPDGITYNARSEIIKTLEAKPDEIVPDSKLEYTNKVLFKGEYYRLKHGKEGYEAIGYLDTYKHGELINSEKIRHEIYSPQAGVVIEGIAEPIENMSVIDNGVILHL